MKFQPFESLPSRSMETFKDVVKDSYSQRYGLEFWEILSSTISRCLKGTPSTIADYGCGPGLFLKDFHKKIGFKKAFAFDYSTVMLEEAQKQLQQIEEPILFHQVDLQQGVPVLPESEKLDVIYSGFLFRALKRSVEILQHWFSVLNQGGIVIIYDWSRFPLREFAETMGTVFSTSLVQRFRNFSIYSLDDVVYLLEHTNFKVCFKKQMNPFHHLIIAQKK